jgi:ArsR family transcriptional regulator
VPDSKLLELSNPGSEIATRQESVSLLAAVSDPVRWHVLRQLTAGQACVCDLQAGVEVAPNLLSYHLKVLRDAGLVTTSRRGRWVDYTLAVDAWARLTAALPVTEAARP